MAFLRTWVGELVALILVAGALELLLPENRMRSYVRLVTGLLVVLSILKPALAIVSGRPDLNLEGFLPDAAAEFPPLAEVQAAAAQLRAAEDVRLQERFQAGLAAAAANAAQQISGVAWAEAGVILMPLEGKGVPIIDRVTVRIGLAGGGRSATSIRPIVPIAPVRPGLSAPVAADAAPVPADVISDQAAAVQGAVQRIVADGLGLALGQVAVVIQDSE